MTWIMEILVEVGHGYQSRKEWKAVRPTRGQPYEFSTKEEATRMLDICYPDVLVEHKRVRENS